MPETEDLILEGEELAALGPVIEEGVGRIHVPSRGRLFDEDGCVEVAIIRPCMSRGKRLRGYAPIYEPSMLGRNASVFEDWHMWMGHMSVPLKEALEELAEQLEEAAGARRLFSELGGRVKRTWYDPSFRTREDDTYGYRPGAVMGKVIPYRASREILEADPDGLHVSIAAYPTAARVASPSWDPRQRGMAVEGFRSSPRGSVDWVLRGGAGGRPAAGRLTEAEEAAVSSLVSFYTPADPKESTTMPKAIKDLTNLEELREHLEEANPDLARALGLPARPAAPEKAEEAAKPDAGYVTKADLDAALRSLGESLRGEVTKQAEKVTEEVDSKLTESREMSALSEAASKLIKGAGLPRRFEQMLLAQYSMLPSGPAPSLAGIQESDERGIEEVLAEAVEADIRELAEMLEEAAGTPVVTGLGGGRRSAVNSNSTGGKGRTSSGAFKSWLRESGMDLGRSAEDARTAIQEMVREGVN